MNALAAIGFILGPIAIAAAIANIKAPNTGSVNAACEAKFRGTWTRVENGKGSPEMPHAITISGRCEGEGEGEDKAFNIAVEGGCPEGVCTWPESRGRLEWTEYAPFERRLHVFFRGDPICYRRIYMTVDDLDRLFAFAFREGPTQCRYNILGSSYERQS